MESVYLSGCTAGENEKLFKLKEMGFRSLGYSVISGYTVIEKYKSLHSVHDITSSSILEQTLPLLIKADFVSYIDSEKHDDISGFERIVATKLNKRILKVKIESPDW